MFWRTNFSSSAGLRPLKSAPKSCLACATRSLPLAGIWKHEAEFIAVFTAFAADLSRTPWLESFDSFFAMSASFFVVPSMMSITFCRSRRVSGAMNEFASGPDSGIPSAL